MRISDWSSGRVLFRSHDAMQLGRIFTLFKTLAHERQRRIAWHLCPKVIGQQAVVKIRGKGIVGIEAIRVGQRCALGEAVNAIEKMDTPTCRSEERRVGKESCSTFRSRWAASEEK